MYDSFDLYRIILFGEEYNTIRKTEKMLLKSSSSYSNSHADLDDLFGEMANIDVDDLYNTAPLLSDDVWKKFELDVAMGAEDMDDFYDDIFFEDSFTWTTSSQTKNCKIRNHDCMWAGHCGSKEHPADEPRLPIRTIPPVPPVISRVPMGINNKQAVASGRSLLLRTAIKQQQQTQQTVPQQQQQQQQHQPVVSPDSPPMSDDEEHKTQTLRILEDVISSCDIEDDSDLCDYFEQKGFLSESAEESTIVLTAASTQIRAAHQYARDNDHSYHKDKNATMHLSNLGIDTPSDSGKRLIL